MKKYANIHGNSGVTAYWPTEDAIRITFRDDDRIYVYSSPLTGKHHVEVMKSLAASGRGLATYIARNRNMLKFSIERGEKPR